MNGIRIHRPALVSAAAFLTALAGASLGWLAEKIGLDLSYGFTSLLIGAGVAVISELALSLHFSEGDTVARLMPSAMTGAILGLFLHGAAWSLELDVSYLYLGLLMTLFWPMTVGFSHGAFSIGGVGNARSAPLRFRGLLEMLGAYLAFTLVGLIFAWDAENWSVAVCIPCLFMLMFHLVGGMDAMAASRAAQERRVDLVLEAQKEIAAGELDRAERLLNQYDRGSRMSALASDPEGPRAWIGAIVGGLLIGGCVYYFGVAGQDRGIPSETFEQMLRMQEQYYRKIKHLPDELPKLKEELKFLEHEVQRELEVLGKEGRQLEKNLEFKPPKMLKRPDYSTAGLSFSQRNRFRSVDDRIKFVEAQLPLWEERRARLARLVQLRERLHQLELKRK